MFLIPSHSSLSFSGRPAYKTSCSLLSAKEKKLKKASQHWREILPKKDDTTFSNYLQFVLNKDVFGDLLPLRELLLLLVP
jgi:hypothetical protein